MQTMQTYILTSRFAEVLFILFRNVPQLQFSKLIRLKCSECHLYAVSRSSKLVYEDQASEQSASCEDDSGDDENRNINFQLSK